jgi:hypothetical protein
VTVFDAKGRAAWTVAVSGKHRYLPGKLAVSREIRFDQIVLVLDATTAFSKPPKVVCRFGETAVPVTTIAVSPSRYRAVATPLGGMSGVFRIDVESWIGGVKQVWQDDVTASCVASATGGEVRSSDGNAVIRFRANDVYRSMLCGLEPVQTPAGTRYRAFPEDVPLAGRPLVSMRCPEGAKEKSFVRAASTGARYRFSRVDPGAGRAEIGGAFGRLLGTYQLLTDAAAPIVRAAVSLRSAMAVQFTITDSLSGVAARSIVAKAGSTLLPVEFSERAKVYFIPGDALTGHKAATVTLTVADNVGNSIRKEIPLR